MSVEGKKNNSIKVTKYCIENSKINKELSMLLVCDNHDVYSKEWFKNIDTPDYIFVAGDFILGRKIEGMPYEESWTKLCPNSFEMLKDLTTLAPVYLSLGNHEWGLGDEDINIIRDMGITVLDNEYVRLPNNIVVGGLTSGLTTNYRKYRADKYDMNSGVRGDYHYEFYHSGKSDYELNTPDYEWIDDFEKQEGYKILLSHHPEYWAIREPMLKNRNIDLVLSGHAHGGQIRILGKGLYAPGQGILPKYTNGVYKGRNGTMIVSAGMSNTYSIPRFWNETEIAYILYETGKCSNAFQE